MDGRFFVSKFVFCAAVMLGTASAPKVTVAQEPEVRVAAIAREATVNHPLDPAIEVARESLRHIQTNVDDYTALFVKRCRVDGDLPPMTFAHLKMRNGKYDEGRVVTPMSVYLDFLKPSSTRGREVIWVEGQNNGKLAAHHGGFANVATLWLDPNGYLAMRGQRYPVTDIGIENLLKKIIERCQHDRQLGACDVQIFRDAKIGKVPCTMVQVTHPEPRPNLSYYRARVYFDNELNVPIRYDSTTWPTEPDGDPVIQEEYTYLRVKLNVGLTDEDFDTENPKYRFR